MIRLTDEEKDQILNMATNVTNPMPLSEVVRYGNAIAQAQLKKVVEWLEDVVITYGDDKPTMRGIPEADWQTLRQEAGKE